ncbi:AcrR family transcriptional regulator [Hamadaea flava]|uniref:TetR/AcrR family transcriptional regulator n=1 Tax=Hamadaea flava TaxID=1742688 RepID=A0ABV8M0Y5_9ACTN|nr:TetR/AcrR family transcriptional regulator [Hamadaea flava]MCP2327007.1 AcrR family transcriptional regulator [Hamadaea flava]
MSVGEGIHRDPPARSRLHTGRQDRILSAAYKVFLVDGYVAAKVEDIAARAEVAKPTIYNYFGTKERLFDQAVGRAIKTLRAELITVTGSLPHRLCAYHLRPALTQWAQAITSTFTRSDVTELRRLLLIDGVRLSGWPHVGRDFIAHPFPMTIRSCLARQVQLGNLLVRSPEEMYQAGQQFVSLALGDVAQLTLIGLAPDGDGDLVVNAGIETFLARYGAPATVIGHQSEPRDHQYVWHEGCLRPVPSASVLG